MQSLKTILIAPGPFSLKATAVSHGWHECSPMSWCEGGRCFQVIDRVEGHVLRVSVTESKRSAKTTALSVLIEGDQVDAAVGEEINRRLRIVFGLDHDIRTFHDLCREHPTLHVIPRIGAGRALRSVSMTENVIKTLCATNVTWSQAVKMINRIGQLGPPLRHFVNLNAWPTPREVLKAGERYLVEVCRVGYRSDAILQFCREVCDGRFDPDSLDKLAASAEVSDDELLAKLRSIRGIGPASAHVLLSFLGRHGRVSVDSSTIAHVARTHMDGKKPTVKQVERIYERFGRWRHLVWWYEHWLTWDTAKTILREEGFDESGGRSRRQRA